MLGPVSDREGSAIGVILAGGRGRRIGGDKAIAALRGRPLIDYPLQAMGAVTGDLAVVAKADTALPELTGAELWIEPARPRHPLVGIVHALHQARGRPILVCAADMPLITPDALRALAQADPGSAPAVIALADGGLQPQLGLYLPAALALLQRAAEEAEQSLRGAVAAIGPALVKLDDPQLVFNVNTSEDLAFAEQLLSRT